MSSSPSKKFDLYTPPPNSARGGDDLGLEYFRGDEGDRRRHQFWWWHNGYLREKDEKAQKRADSLRKADAKRWFQEDGILIPKYTPCEKCTFQIYKGTEDTYSENTDKPGYYKDTVKCPRLTCPSYNKPQENINKGEHNPAMPWPLAPGERRRKKEQQAEEKRQAQLREEEHAQALAREDWEENERYMRYEAARKQDEQMRADRERQEEERGASFRRKLKGKGKMVQNEEN